MRALLVAHRRADAPPVVRARAGDQREHAQLEEQRASVRRGPERADRTDVPPRRGEAGHGEDAGARESDGGERVHERRGRGAALARGSTQDGRDADQHEDEQRSEPPPGTEQVGRIRRDPSHERALNLWIVGNNLRKGAATNAVQIAELLRVRGLLGREPARPTG